MLFLGYARRFRRRNAVQAADHAGLANRIDFA
jgi:hypothetical protein